jgi:hypothetical protein
MYGLSRLWYGVIGGSFRADGGVKKTRVRIKPLSKGDHGAPQVGYSSVARVAALRKWFHAENE